MKASVIIANYNNAKFVKDCLNSLISQTYKNVEIIFFDDNSLDESIEIVEKYENIKIIKNKEQTKFGSLNQMNAFKKAVADQIIDAQQKLNVNGVPHFFITAVNSDVARSFNFPGAQDTRFFTNALSKLNAIVHETDASKL